MLQNVKKRPPPRQRVDQQVDSCNNSDDTEDTFDKTKEVHVASPVPAQIQLDHVYHVTQSPKMLKQRLDHAIEHMQTLRKQVIFEQRKGSVLSKQVDLLNAVIGKLKEKSLLTNKGGDNLHSSRKSQCSS